MSELEIPERAVAKAVDALYAARDSGKVMDDAARYVHKVASPITVAAELRRLVHQYANTGDEFPPLYAGLILDRATELDPEGGS